MYTRAIIRCGNNDCLRGKTGGHSRSPDSSGESFPSTRVKALFTAPTTIRAIKREDPNGEYLKSYDISRFETLFLAGERLDPDTYHWGTQLLQRPVVDHWWQTETAWAICGNFRGLEFFLTKPGSATKPMPGYDLKVLDPVSAKELGPGEMGVLAVKLPLPPGNLPTLWNNDQRFVEWYMAAFPGYYITGDGGYMMRKVTYSLWGALMT